MALVPTSAAAPIPVAPGPLPAVSTVLLHLPPDGRRRVVTAAVDGLDEAAVRRTSVHVRVGRALRAPIRGVDAVARNLAPVGLLAVLQNGLRNERERKKRDSLTHVRERSFKCGVVAQLLFSVHLTTARQLCANCILWRRRVP